MKARPLFRNLRAPFWCHALGALLPAHAAYLGGGLVLAGLGAKVLGFFAAGDPYDLDGAADHVGGALFAFRSDGHACHH